MSPDAAQLVEEWRELSARHARIAQALERALQDGHRLSVPELEALQQLDERGEDGCRLQQLVENVHMSQSALSRLVSRLEDRGLVVRTTCVDDRRGIYAHLTERGADTLRAAEETQREVLRRVLPA